MGIFLEREKALYYSFQTEIGLFSFRDGGLYGSFQTGIGLL